jgi:large subunit ribosomal protein L13
MGAQAHRATRSAKPGEVAASWHVIDATDVVLGRMATKIADTGDFVIVINAEKVKLTGRKREQKTYYRHTGYTGNLKSRTADEVLSGPYADRVVSHAVRGMLPKNSLGRQIFKKLKVYAGPDHPHAAQKPKELKLG